MADPKNLDNVTRELAEVIERAQNEPGIAEMEAILQDSLDVSEWTTEQQALGVTTSVVSSSSSGV